MSKELEIVIGEIDGKLAQLYEHVSKGSAETFEEYKKTCGEIKGLLTARGYAENLLKRILQSDE